MNKSIDRAIKQAREGKEEGYLLLFRTFSDGIFALVNSLIADAAEAEEVTQDAFLKVFRHFESYDPRRASFPTYLRRAAYREAISQLRQKRPLPTVPLEALIPSDNDDSSPPYLLSPDDDADHSDELLSLLASLPEDERLLLRFFYADGMTTDEVAYVVGATSTAVHSRLQRIRLKLRRLAARTLSTF